MVSRANSSDLKVPWMTNVGSMLCHRWGSISVNPKTLTWLLKEISWLPTLKWLSCDALTLLRDPTTTPSVLSLFSFSLLPIIQLLTESTHCSMSWISEWKSDGADDCHDGEVECHQQIYDDCTFFEKWCQTVAEYIQSKEYWAQDRNLRNPVMKLHMWRDLTVDADRLESIRQIWWIPLKRLARYAKHVMQACKENAVVQHIKRG